MRLIDADELLQAPYFLDESIPERVMFIDDVLTTPTVDAVKVLRCNDCKHHFRKGNWCKLHSHGSKRSDFCSFGEAVNAKT